SAGHRAQERRKPRSGRVAAIVEGDATVAAAIDIVEFNGPTVRCLGLAHLPSRGFNVPRRLADLAQASPAAGKPRAPAARKIDVDQGLLRPQLRPYMWPVRLSPQVPHAGLRGLWFQSCQTTAAFVPDWGGLPCRGGINGLREVHGSRQGFRAGRARYCPARRAPAVRPRSPVEGAAR